MDIKKKVMELMAPYIENKELDSEALTTAASYLLSQNGIEHVTMFGELCIGEKCIPHFWLILEDTGQIVDFRCDGPNDGVFAQDEALHLRHMGSEKHVYANIVSFKKAIGEYD